ncbi:MAG TPA: hypothetical protein DDW16_02940 [Clostridiales bacterium]|nr:hypothetical protein [Clostridiales bacterium]
MYYLSRFLYLTLILYLKRECSLLKFTFLMQKLICFLNKMFYLKGENFYNRVKYFKFYLKNFY